MVLLPPPRRSPSAAGGGHSHAMASWLQINIMLCSLAPPSPKKKNQPNVFAGFSTPPKINFMCLLGAPPPKTSTSCLCSLDALPPKDPHVVFARCSTPPPPINLMLCFLGSPLPPKMSLHALFAPPPKRIDLHVVFATPPPLK